MRITFTALGKRENDENCKREGGVTINISESTLVIKHLINFMFIEVLASTSITDL